jgi:hypothetical protein
MAARLPLRIHKRGTVATIRQESMVHAQSIPGRPLGDWEPLATLPEYLAKEKSLLVARLRAMEVIDGRTA